MPRYIIIDVLEIIIELSEIKDKEKTSRQLEKNNT